MICKEVIGTLVKDNGFGLLVTKPQGSESVFLKVLKGSSEEKGNKSGTEDPIKFGFLIVAQLTAAQELNTEFNGKWIGRSKLAMYLARDSYRQVQTLPSQKWMDRTIIEDRNNRKAFKGQSSALEVKSSMEIRDGKTVEGLVQQPSFCAVQVGQKFGLNCKELESISQTSLKQDLCLEASRDSSKSMKNRLHDEDQSSYILDMQDRRLQKSQSHQSLARDHIRYLDKWERNKWNLSEQVDNSSSESSKRKYG
ncbi:hypothetical protein DCAR_0311953 [Daucus carota subsp. sativus]|uniref:Uncharacterized protein n=1 Tax=Daucus carota subsp. sativus TaxID=79200 RepID=A0A166ASZ1_DAUCS|nr:hypothetical protein DCAR_0311953 [Daucus carota subsp. sativus]